MMLRQIKTKIFPFPLHVPASSVLASGPLNALLAGQLWEPDETRAVFRICRKFNLRNFLDVGANIGYYSYQAALREMRVIAVEPMPELAESIRRTAKESRLKIRVIEKACWSEKTSIRMNRSLVPGWHSAFKQKTGGADIGSIEVETTTLDEILPDFQPCFLKIDVEGAESEVLLGGAKSLSKSKDSLVVMVEFAPQYHDYDSSWVPLVLNLFPFFAFYDAKLNFVPKSTLPEFILHSGTINLFLSTSDLEKLK